MKISRTLAQLSNISHALLPGVCLLCKESRTKTNLLCDFCIEQLARNTKPCQQCAHPLTPQNSTNLCPSCLNYPPAFDTSYAPFIYQPPLQHLLRTLKFHQQLIYAKLFAELICLNPVQTEAQCIIPMPMHNKRLQHRGYNQALEIAKQVQRRLNIPMQRNLCRRIKHSASQSETLSRQRREFRQTFTVANNNYQHVIIIDDVITTGSSAHSLAKQLKKSGITVVEVWCALRATMIN